MLNIETVQSRHRHHLQLSGDVRNDLSQGLLKSFIDQVLLVDAGDLQGGLGGRARIVDSDLDEVWKKKFEITLFFK